MSGITRRPKVLGIHRSVQERDRTSLLGLARAAVLLRVTRGVYFARTAPNQTATDAVATWAGPPKTTQPLPGVQMAVSRHRMTSAMRTRTIGLGLYLWCKVLTIMALIFIQMSAGPTCSARDCVQGPVDGPSSRHG